jgi:hypothetical protein
MATKRQVFYSFHFDNDVHRVQLIRNIGVLEGNAPVSANEWEEVKRNGDSAIKKWIDDNMKNRSCVIVLVGEQTANRKWVKHEILKAWKEKKGLLGIYIHNVNCMRNGKGKKGANPFDHFKFPDGSKLSKYVGCFDPSSTDAYNHIAANIDTWIEQAINSRQ